MYQEVYMEGKQNINCTVSSCKYNNQEKAKCNLQSIQVEPIEAKNTKEPDESMCASYKNINNQKEDIKQDKIALYLFHIYQKIKKYIVIKKVKYFSYIVDVLLTY